VNADADAAVEKVRPSRVLVSAGGGGRLSEGRVVDGDPSEVEERLLDEQEVIKSRLGEDYSPNKPQSGVITSDIEFCLCLSRVVDHSSSPSPYRHGQRAKDGCDQRDRKNKIDNQSRDK
jgi:hypothetical protein